MDAIKVKLIGLSRGGGGNLQPNKDATPTEQTQIVQPDPGYDGLRQVTVDPIPDEYADVSNVDAGAGDVRVGKIIVGSDGETITGTMRPEKPEEVGHATPTEQAQTVTPTAGSVFSEFEVAAIPSEYADVSSVDATAADVRTGKVIVDAQGDTVTGVMLPQKPEQSKSATPTTSAQTILPDTGYALSQVNVGAIPSEYADVSDVTATAGTVLTGSDFVDSSGTLVHGACDYDADTSDATATAGQIESGATAYVNGAKVTGTMPIRTTDVEISDLSPVPIPAGSYDGTVSARLADPTEVDAQYIAQGHSILGVNGSLVAQDNLPALLNNTLTAINCNVTHISDYEFYGKTALTSVSLNNVESMTSANNNAGGAYAFYGCSNLRTVSLSSCTEIWNKAYLFVSCAALELVSLPLLRRLYTSRGFFGTTNLSRLNLPAIEEIYTSSSGNDSPFRDSGIQLIDCGSSLATLSGSGGAFFGATHLDTLILRSTAIPTLSTTAAFTNTPFASGGTGGTLYIKKSLYDHLGDGTSDDYLSATNWSVVFSANPNNQILPIEGSPYE